ncbi:MAG: metallophosphoesterase [Isosphaeraceae bacterium]|nr:metallophosphoesterase [Isosphaeraceae bacterium]
MSYHLTRRRFLALAAALASGGAAAEAEPFAILALGDVHFDRLDHHDREWLRRDHPNDVHQVENYSRITREVTPALLAELRRTIACSDVPVQAVVQLGDLIEGLCGTPELAHRQCEEAVAFLRDADLGAPFLFTKGNHDITGPGAREAFDRVLRPFNADQAGRVLEAASFVIERGEALFAFLDAYDPGALDWLERTLAAQSARLVFVLLHPPVVPFGARATWHLFAKPAQQDQRRRLLHLLGKHRAIVLCGHLHKYGVVVRRTDCGPFLQLALCSVLPRPDVRPKDVVEGVAHFGPDLVRLEPKFSPATEPERRAALQAEAPFIQYYEYADAPGYARLTIRGTRVTADLQAGLGRPPWRRLNLTALRDKEP